MERENGNRSENDDDENDSSTLVQNLRIGQHSLTHSTQVLNPSNNILGNAEITQFLQPSGSSLHLDTNLAALQSYRLGQQLGMDALIPSVLAARTHQYMDRIQQLLLLQVPPTLSAAQNPVAALNNFSPSQISGPSLWLTCALAQTSAERQMQYQQANNLLANLTTNTGNARVTGSSASRTGPASGNQTTKRSHGPFIMYLECDEENLSHYQCLLRQQIEVFEADFDDVQWNAQGRNKAIMQGQVGIRCRHCTGLESWERARGAVYYSATLDGLYQAAQNMAKNHLCKHCKLIPSNTKAQLLELRDSKQRAAGGKTYWADSARVLGVQETQNGLRFRMSTMTQ